MYDINDILTLGVLQIIFISRPLVLISLTGVDPLLKSRALVSCANGLCYCITPMCYLCNELRGVIWPDSHNFLLWSHGRLLSMKSLVRVLPAAAYTFNTVPICDPGGPNPHGRVWETFPVPVRDFTPRLHYFRETGFPKPAPDSLGIGLSPNSSPNTRSYSLNQSVHY